MRFFTFCLHCVSWASITSALQLDITDPRSIRNAAKIIAQEMLDTWYPGDEPGQIPGLLVKPYYWWSCGAMFGTLIDYWYYTGDSAHNQLVIDGMMHQIGPRQNFEPPNQTSSLGNDDQAFWALSAMSAAEQKFPDPPADMPSWLTLAKTVFERQAARWDPAPSQCGNAGLKWQAISVNQGYNYRNSISNGCFFNLATRLGAYTGNSTYLEWGVKAYEWSKAIGLITDRGEVIDGAWDSLDGVNTNCTTTNKDRWTYNSGVYLHGAAVMWNQTTGAERSAWEERIQLLLRGSDHFFQNDIMREDNCEDSPTRPCNKDQESFKAYLLRWSNAAGKVAPFISDVMATRLEKSAVAAAKSCTGQPTGNTCGQKWTTGSWDGYSGAGYQMSALEAIQGLLEAEVPGPVTLVTGGTSTGDANAEDSDLPEALRPITTADRAGAGIVTAILLILTIGGAWLLTS